MSHSPAPSPPFPPRLPNARVALRRGERGEGYSSQRGRECAPSHYSSFFPWNRRALGSPPFCRKELPLPFSPGRLRRRSQTPQPPSFLWWRRWLAAWAPGGKSERLLLLLPSWTHARGKRRRGWTETDGRSGGESCFTTAKVKQSQAAKRKRNSFFLQGKMYNHKHSKYVGIVKNTFLR